jgi:hypothetical protein
LLLILKELVLVGFRIESKIRVLQVLIF